MIQCTYCGSKITSISGLCFNAACPNRSVSIGGPLPKKDEHMVEINESEKAWEVFQGKPLSYWVQLEKELQKEREVVDFYADKNNWFMVKHKGYDYEFLEFKIKKRDTKKEGDDLLGGKRARQRQKERGE